MFNLSNLFFFNIFFPYLIILPVFLCFLVKTAFKGVGDIRKRRKYIPFDTTDTLLICESFFHVSSFMWVSMIKSFRGNWSIVGCGWLSAFQHYHNMVDIFIHYIAFKKQRCCTEKELWPFTGLTEFLKLCEVPFQQGQLQELDTSTYYMQYLNQYS